MSGITHIDETVTIGGDLTVGRIGYGAMQLIGPKVWGEYPDHDKGVALLREVVAAGMTYIDTADVYGPHSNEELIREALHPYPDNLVIATKGGFVRSGPEYADMGAVGNRHYLQQAANMSARRLGLDPHRPLLPTHAYDDRRSIRGDHRDARGDAPGRPHPPDRPLQRQRRPAPHRPSDHGHRRRHRPLQRRRAPRRGRATGRQETGIVFSPWHPGAIPGGDEDRPFHAVIDPIAEKYDATPQQIALAWQLHRTSRRCPSPAPPASSTSRRTSPPLTFH
jgi:pyridoxine 4-dehydrogenase